MRVAESSSHKLMSCDLAKDNAPSHRLGRSRLTVAPPAKSTGPITDEGKQRSHCNAVRHGLTAETVIGALEDAEDYQAFEAAIIADYDVQSAVERETGVAVSLCQDRRSAAMIYPRTATHYGGISETSCYRPPCRKYVRNLEAEWWKKVGIDPTICARTLLLASHPHPATAKAEGASI